MVEWSCEEQIVVMCVHGVTHSEAEAGMQTAVKSTKVVAAAMATVTAFVLGGVTLGSAAVVAYDQASYAVYADNSPIGDNGGYGSGAWSHELSGSGATSQVVVYNDGFIDGHHPSCGEYLTPGRMPTHAAAC